MLLEPDGHLLINGCFNWMMNQIFTKEMVGNHHFHTFKTGCLGYQAEQHFDLPMFLELCQARCKSQQTGGDRRLRRPAGPQVTGSGGITLRDEWSE